VTLPYPDARTWTTLSDTRSVRPWTEAFSSFRSPVAAVGRAVPWAKAGELARRKIVERLRESLRDFMNTTASLQTRERPEGRPCK
jgi:hypothetical protein